jgi:peptidoglycan/xylan/chitin deacetylase (PgdA/CDA1 family)
MLGGFSRRIFLGAAQRRFIARGLPMFTYHKIAAPPRGTRDPFLYVTPDQFHKQLAQLRQAGFASTSVEATRGWEGGHRQQAVITFDDGFSSVCEHGSEILKRNQFQGTQFLVAGFLGRKNEWDMAKGDVAETLMDESQVREWLAAGNQIGSHSMTHRNLRHLNAAEAREEISGSKRSLEDRFGVAIEHFCYPFGSWNSAVRDLVTEAGYLTACTVQFGVNQPTTPPYELRRIIPLTSGEMLRKIRHRLARKIGRLGGQG